ncbi:hypothetical protein BHM03_00026527 [Ensete ventricosum]|nr:hypothetical protein BHM03_00026527 [Ensete ventricosum]
MPDMDLETENRLAALLMEEARRLRLQAEKEGVHVYLHQPNVRGRPNSRFLTATVLGVQQAHFNQFFVTVYRAKRGRGAVGSRMDEAGPYISQTCSDQDGHSPSHDVRVKEEWENRILGPEKPSFLKLDSALCNDSDAETRVWYTSSSSKCHSKKRRSREEKLEKRRTKKRSKHHSKSRRRKDYDV